MRNGGSIKQGGWFGGLSGAQKMHGTAMYEDGKYYWWLDRGKGEEAYMLPESQLDDPHLEDFWGSVPAYLALPEALTVFAPNDPFNAVAGRKVPKFVESGSIPEEKLEYDKYVVPYQTKGGTLLYEKQFWFFYKAGELQKIDMRIQRPGQKEVTDSTLKIIRITSEIPKKALEIPNNCKIYAARTGDMNELLGNLTLLEKYKKPKADKSSEKA